MTPVCGSPGGNCSPGSRTLPPDAPDDRKYDFSMIDDALTKLDDRDMRLTLRVSPTTPVATRVPQQYEYRDSGLDAFRRQHQLPRAGDRFDTRGDAGRAELERSRLTSTLSGSWWPRSVAATTATNGSAFGIFRLRGFQ